MNQAEPSPNLPSIAKSVPGIAQSLALAALCFGLFTAVAVALRILFRFSGMSLDMFSSLLVQQAIAWPLTLWVGLRWSGISFREAYPLTRFPIRIVPALFIATFGATILLLAAASLIHMPQALKDDLIWDLFQGRVNSSKVALFFPVILVAPLAEEFFFRGLVLRGYLGRYSAAKAVWVSAVYFGAFHLPQNPWQATMLMPLGLGFAWLYLRTGSLIPGIISHATVNFSANFLLGPLALAVGYDTKAMKALGHLPPAILAIGAAMAGIGGLFLWWQLTKLSKYAFNFRRLT
jgi:membrane protease YdiL (CAAX protease family)